MVGSERRVEVLVQHKVLPITERSVVVTKSPIFDSPFRPPVYLEGRLNQRKLVRSLLRVFIERIC